MERQIIAYFFERPTDISTEIMGQIQDLIERCGGVGTAYIEENLRNAFFIGYAMHGDHVIGTVPHKYPKEEYRRKIEAATGLDLTGYIERGYTSVEPLFRDQDIADILIKGLIERSKSRNIYVTIRLDNIPPLKLTYKNNMFFAGKFIHHKTGNEIGVFVSHEMSSKG